MTPISQTKAIATYFRGSPRDGRTTTLVNKVTGEKLIEVMGATTRKDAYRSYSSR